MIGRTKRSKVWLLASIVALIVFAQGGCKVSGKETPWKIWKSPERYTFVLEGMPHGEPYNVGQMYYQFGQSILSGDNCQPDFYTAVESR